MAPTTVVADVVDGLYDLLAGSAALAAVGGLKVFDGPPTIDRARSLEVWVGATGFEPDDNSPVGFDQRWATMGGGGQRDENITVPCCIWVVGGTTSMRTRRRTAADVLEIIAGLVHGSTLGLDAVLCGGAEILTGQLAQMQTDTGASVALAFTVRATARLTS